MPTGIYGFLVFRDVWYLQLLYGSASSAHCLIPLCSVISQYLSPELKIHKIQCMKTKYDNAHGIRNWWLGLLISGHTRKQRMTFLYFPFYSVCDSSLGGGSTQSKSILSPSLHLSRYTSDPHRCLSSRWSEGQPSWPWSPSSFPHQKMSVRLPQIPNELSDQYHVCKFLCSITNKNIRSYFESFTKIKLR